MTARGRGRTRGHPGLGDQGREFIFVPRAVGRLLSDGVVRPAAHLSEGTAEMKKARCMAVSQSVPCVGRWLLLVGVAMGEPGEKQMG